ncbi:hypothetical protein [Ornithinimicrobium faecis]|uniref:hypothetical protein n=1 Tax=Ornithinimicrobium faecis TaxID=2934158 RepID=UPI00211823AD|nr:hypothetical protein [Ornithinimicrobium sp. HY1745]
MKSKPRPRFSPLRKEVLERRTRIGRGVAEKHDGVATRRALRGERPDRDRAGALDT